jgi:DNA gyrase/topoisomerase IV subunit A
VRSGLPQVATTVGDVSGRYHPHGDPLFTIRLCVWRGFFTAVRSVDVHGNFGSIGGTRPRPTVTRGQESRISIEMSPDIEKETVDFIPNFDNAAGSRRSARAFPNMLANGS